MEAAFRCVNPSVWQVSVAPARWLLEGSAPLGDKDPGQCSAKGTVISVSPHGRTWGSGKQEPRPKARAIPMLLLGLVEAGSLSRFRPCTAPRWRARAPSPLGCVYLGQTPHSAPVTPTTLPDPAVCLFHPAEVGKSLDPCDFPAL